MSHPLPVAVFATSDETVCVMRRHLPRKHQSKLIMMLTKLRTRLCSFGLGRSRKFTAEGWLEVLVRFCSRFKLWAEVALSCTWLLSWCADQWAHNDAGEKNNWFVFWFFLRNWMRKITHSTLEIVDACQDVAETPTHAERVRLSSPFIRVLSWAKCAC